MGEHTYQKRKNSDALFASVGKHTLARKALAALLIAGFSSAAYPVDCSQPLSGVGVTGKRSLSETPWGYQKTGEEVYSGKLSQRFEVRTGDCFKEPHWDDCKTFRERSEIGVSNTISPGERRFISYRIYLPKDFVAPVQIHTTLGQIHQKGGPTTDRDGIKNRPPVLMFIARGEDYRLCWQRVQGERSFCKFFDLAKIEDMKGRWTEVAIDFDSDIKSGGARVWIDGEKKVDIKHNLVDQEPQYFYFKYGIYRGLTSKHPGPIPTQVVFYDEVRMGKRFHQVSDKICKHEALD